MKIQFSLSFEYKTRTPEEIKALPDYSHATAESVYRVKTADGFIAIDNLKGMGATPDNQNVLYKGCMVALTPDEFLSLALPVEHDRSSDTGYLRKQLADGTGIGSPCLYVNIDKWVDQEPGYAVVEGHEGRARCLVLKELGVKALPVQILFQGYRSRHMGDHAKFEAWLNSGIVPQGKKNPRSFRFKLI